MGERNEGQCVADVDRLNLGGHHRQRLRSGQRGHQVRARTQPVGGRHPGQARTIVDMASGMIPGVVSHGGPGGGPVKRTGTC